MPGLAYKPLNCRESPKAVGYLHGLVPWSPPARESNRVKNFDRISCQAPLAVPPAARFQEKHPANQMLVGHPLEVRNSDKSPPTAAREDAGRELDPIIEPVSMIFSKAQSWRRSILWSSARLPLPITNPPYLGAQFLDEAQSQIGQWTIRWCHD